MNETTITEDALIRQLKDVDRKLTRATDPYQTVLSERGVALLQQYRDELYGQLKALPKRPSALPADTNECQLALCMRPELWYANSPVLTGNPARKSARSQRKANGNGY